MLKSVVQKYPELDVAALLRHTSSVAALAELTGLDRRLLHRRCHSGLSIVEADLCATAVGCHPSEVWAFWFDLVGAERRSRRAAAARRYRRTAKGREVSRRADRQYKQSARAYLTLYQRQWRDDNRDRYRAAARAYHDRNRDAINARRRERRAKKAAA